MGDWMRFHSVIHNAGDKPIAGLVAWISLAQVTPGYEQVWDFHFDPQSSVIDTHISRLRKKIDKGFDNPLLHTVRGMGYRLGIDP